MAKEISDVCGTVMPYTRWEGSYKDLTKDCLGCSYYNGNEAKYMGKREKGLCYWGVAVKVLVEPKKYRICSLLKQLSPRTKRIREKKELEKELKRYFQEETSYC
jgi:hypothetical protein